MKTERDKQVGQASSPSPAPSVQATMAARERALTVAVVWHDAEYELPDSDTTVLLHCPQSSDPIWFGYHDGETWRSVDNEKHAEGVVTHWADLPAPPRKA